MRILLIEDNPGDARLIREILRGDTTMELAVATTLYEALQVCATGAFDAALVDLGLPDSSGLRTVLRLQEQAPHLAIVVFTGSDDDELALDAAKAGAQDYLVKGRVGLDMLRRSLRYAIARKRAEAQIRASEERLRALTARIQEAREAERTAIAGEIHDELGQALTGLKMDVAWLQTRLQDGASFKAEPLRKKTAAMLPLIDELIRTVQRISSDLRPSMLDDLGLVSAIEWYVATFRERTGLDVELVLPAEEIVLDTPRSTALYRVLQEALTNVVRHAAATRIQVSLSVAADGFFVEIRDNGCGIPSERVQDNRSLGLLGMRERLLPFGGAILIHGEPGQGTVVTVTIPMRRQS